MGVALALLGLALELRMRWRIRRYRSDQERLRAAYGITTDTPVLPYGDEQRANISAAAARLGASARFAATSGSTAEPKRILYPTARVRAVKRAFVDALTRDFRRAPWRRHSLYVFGSLRECDSVTALMLEETRGPSRVEVLQAPYRAHAWSPVRELARDYGDVAARVWVLALSNPGVLYATNPSTLASFLDAVQRDWTAATALVRDFVTRPARFAPGVHAAARRLTSRGAAARLRTIAAAQTPLPFAGIAPGTHTYVCWTGGYVRPFLDRVAEHLPAERYRLLPMYSMSTETLETTPVYHGASVSFIPIGEGVLYEFVPEAMDDTPMNLRLPHELSGGRSYAMVVSDAYGLRRYQTDDLFRCVGHVRGLPDLRFERRRSLSYSFTGEKLTGEQVTMALDRLRTELSALSREAFFACMPAHSRAELPHYVLVAAVRYGAASTFELGPAARRFDSLLREINGEYRSKRESGRLGPVAAATVPLEEFVRRVGGSHTDWEGQFKFLPLYRHLWDAQVAPRTAPT